MLGEHRAFVFLRWCGITRRVPAARTIPGSARDAAADCRVSEPGGPEIRRRREDVVRFRVQGQCAGPELRVDVSDHAVFIGRILVQHGNQALAARSKHQPRGGIVRVSVRIATDWRGSDHLAVVRVDHHHHLVAGGEQAVVRGVKGQGRRSFAGRQRPHALDRQRLGVEFLDGAFVLDVDPQVALAVQRGLFGFAAKFHSADNLPGVGVDHGRVIALAVEGEDALGLGIVNDRIRVLAFDGNHRDRLDGLQIDHGDRIGVSVAREALAQIGGQRDPVHVLGIFHRNIADGLPRDLIHDHHVGTARKINAMGIRIHTEIVPSAVAADRNPSEDFVTRGRRPRVGPRSRNQRQKAQGGNPA